MNRWPSRLFWVLLAAAVLAAGCRRHEPIPAADPYSLSVALSTNVVRVGDVVRLTLTSGHPRDVHLSIPTFQRGKEIVVRSQASQTTALPDNRAQTVAVCDLSSFVVGDHLLFSNGIQCVRTDGSVAKTHFPDARLTVVTALADTNSAPRDIKDILRWPGAVPRWIPGLLIIAVLAALAAFVARRFLSKPRTFLRYPPPSPPHDVALNALRDLLAQGLIEAGEVEEFYVRLSAIVRRYIEDRFRLRAPERTTEEFIREAISSRLLSHEHQMLTRDFLEQCDLVKFARHRPEQNAMRAGYAAAERLVRETIPAPTAPAEEAPP
jgi:hypothetical protein